MAKAGASESREHAALFDAGLRAPRAIARALLSGFPGGSENLRDEAGPALVLSTAGGVLPVYV